MSAKRYVIWDKTTDVITPIGEVLTPEQWIAKYPIANVLPTVTAGGTINGAFFGVYAQMVDMYEKAGCDFSACTTEQEYLDAIEAFEDARNSASATTVSDATRTADALEDLVLLQELSMDSAE